MKIKLFDKYLNTKKKKNIAFGTAVAALLTVGAVSVYAFNGGNDAQLILVTDSINAELGEVVSTDIKDYLDQNKVNKTEADDILKKTTSKSNFEFEVTETKDENGNTVSKEKKEYPKTGNYKIDFSYKKEKRTVKVKVEDTTAPTIVAPDEIDIIQYTDLSTFNFAELLQVTDYSDVNDWQIDTSKVDVNTLGTYDLKISISDVEKNKAEKEMKINVVEAPIVAEGEVAVTEIVTDENGNKKTVVTKKSSSEVSSKDNVTTGKPVENTDKVESGSGNSATKPSIPSGSTGGNTGNNGGNSNSGNTGDNKPAHTHSWEAVTKVVNHPAETKVVHHDAVTKTEMVTVIDKPAWDEPIYEYRTICNKCGKDITNSLDYHYAFECDGSYSNKKVQVGTKHHDAVTHQEEKTVVIKEAWDETVIIKEAWDETVTTGYKCECGATK